MSVPRTTGKNIQTQEAQVTSALVSAAKKGDRQCFDTLIDMYDKELRFYFKSLGLDPELIKDTKQEVWLRAWKDLQKQKHPLSFKGWLFKIARWRALDAREDLRRRQGKPLTEQQAADLPASRDDDPVRRSEQKELGELMDADLDKLSPAHREVIILRYLVDIMPAELASILGIPINTVMSRLHYAIRRLKGSRCWKTWEGFIND
jgi:RNA polymerase sigma-70 factor (ECF subfamily)